LKLTQRIRLAGLGLALLLVTFTMASTTAQAANDRGCMGTGTEVVYYSDANLTNEVGRYTTNCNGVCSGSGRVTQYYDIFYLSCPPPPL
jgi:hypothetical protein